MEDIFIHPSAIVDEGAVIGAGTKIWHFTHVMTGATLGTGLSLEIMLKSRIMYPFIRALFAKMMFF
jgi:acyl-[acyl carrier protein]--UDP-N-acetylglucosamine O-acyltransferase